jgi:DNA-binding MarR family transcriptional regulator
VYYIWYVPRTSSDELKAADNVGFLLAKASQRFNERLAQAFAERGFGEVRAGHGSVLVPLFDRDGLRMLDLAATSRLSKQSMTALVRQCEEAGLVERRRDVWDRRSFRIHLTDRGRAFQRVAEEVLAELDAELVRSLGTRNRDALTRALKGVMDL